jgi:hypothetical protein
MEMTRNLLQDSFVRTPAQLVQQKEMASAFMQWFKVATEVGSRLAGRTLASPAHISRLRQGIREMSHLNPRISEITSPVVLVFGAEDIVVDDEKVIPDDVAKNERETYLKDHLFKKSPFVRMLVAKKQSNHGLPYFRSNSVAKASWGLLNRFHRQKQKRE